MRKWICLFMALVLLTGMTACGAAKSKPIPADRLFIGALFADNGKAGCISFYQFNGLEKAVSTTEIPAENLICKYNITDLSDKKTETTTAASSTKASEPESYTDAEGKPHIKAVPVTPAPSETASEAVADLLKSGCQVICFTDEIFDSLSDRIADEHKDILCLQYNGTHSRENLLPYSVKAEDGFYLAGIVSAAEGVKQIGFTGGKENTLTKQWVNAFAQGVLDGNSNAKITLRFTGRDMDLSLEKTIPQKMIQDGCDLLVQSVYSALPVTAAAEGSDGKGKKPIRCIGFGTDMYADAGKRYLCSVILDYYPVFSSVIESVLNGKPSPKNLVGGTVEDVVYLSSLNNCSDDTKAALDALVSRWKKRGKTDYTIAVNENEYLPNIVSQQEDKA